MIEYGQWDSIEMDHKSEFVHNKDNWVSIVEIEQKTKFFFRIISIFIIRIK